MPMTLENVLKNAEFIFSQAAGSASPLVGSARDKLGASITTFRNYMTPPTIDALRNLAVTCGAVENPDKTVLFRNTAAYDSFVARTNDWATGPQVLASSATSVSLPNTGVAVAFGE